MCFDKTGTLTEDGLDLYGLRPIILNKSKLKNKKELLILNKKKN